MLQGLAGKKGLETSKRPCGLFFLDWGGKEALVRIKLPWGYGPRPVRASNQRVYVVGGDHMFVVQESPLISRSSSYIKRFSKEVISCVSETC